MRRRLATLLALAALGAALLAGCGGGERRNAARAPPPKEFPQAQGKTISQLLHGSGATPSKLVVAPASEVFDTGVERYPFGVFTPGQEQVEDVEVALYFAKDGKSKVIGPLPGEAGNAADEARLPLPERLRPGRGEVRLRGAEGRLRQGRLLARGRDDQGQRTASSKRPASPAPAIGEFPKVPKVGERPPKITTLTAADVGNDLEKIDTRVPPDQMHKVDFAEVLGKKPIVLVFATPALCQSRVCGPVVDVAQQVADKYEPQADFIHQEVYVDNEIAKGIRPQLKAFGLPTEPWTYLIGKEGVIKDRLSGAYGVDELEEAMQTIVPLR